MAIVANKSRPGVTTNGVVRYAAAQADAHINTVNTGCGTDITGLFVTSDDRGGTVQGSNTGIQFATFPWTPYAPSPA